MHRYVTAAVVTMLFGVAGSGPASSAAPLPKLRALVLTGQNNHDWRATTPVVVRQLEESGRFAVEVTESPKGLTLADFAAYDVLVDNYFGERLGAETELALLDYIASGGGFVVIHAANNAFEGWDDFDSLVGICWRAGAGHGFYHRYTVTITEPDHPILRGVPHFLHAPDELYHNLRWWPGTTARAIAWAYSRPEEAGTGRYEPMLLVNTWGKGRMFHTAMGHDARSLEGAYHAAILVRGTEWAATGRVTVPLPASLPRESLIEPAAADRSALVDSWVALGVRPEDAAAIPDGGALALIQAALHGTGAGREVARQQLVWLGAEAIPGLVSAVTATDGEQLEAASVDLAIAAAAARDEGAASEALALLGPLTASREYTPTRLAAIRALGMVGSQQAVDLLGALVEDPAVGGSAARALAQAPGLGATLALIRHAHVLPEERHPEVIGALGYRGDPASVPFLKRALESPSSEAAALAAEALGRFEPRVALPALRDGLKAARDHAVREAAALAMVRLARCAAAQGQPAAALAALADAASDGPPAVRARVALAAALVPGPRADDLLEGLARDADGAVRAAAYRAIGRRGGAGALDTLIGALSDAAPEVREAAFESAVRIAGSVGAAADGSATLRVAKRLLAEARTDGERAKALSVVTKAPSAEAKGVVLDALSGGPGPMLDEAVAAAIAVGGVLAEAGEAAAAADLLSRALTVSSGGPLASEIARRLADLGVSVDVARVQGFLTSWHLIGPFPNAAKSAFDRAFPPEDGVDLSAPVPFEGRELRWRAVTTDHPQARVNLEALFETRQDVCAYAYTTVQCEEEADALLKLGSDDGIVVWVNGVRLHGINVDRPLAVDSDVVPVRLKAGENTILLKVLQGGGQWEFCARLVTPDGRPIAR